MVELYYAALPKKGLKMLNERLTLTTIRQANIARNKDYKNAKGEITDTLDEWSVADFFTALVGEVGELGNFLKKVRRGDFEQEEVDEDIRKELADILTYLDLLAARLNVDLEVAYISKWNEVSRRVGSSCRLIQNQVIRID